MEKKELKEEQKEIQKEKAQLKEEQHIIQELEMEKKAWVRNEDKWGT